MDLEMTLKYYCATINIPFALYDDGVLVKDYFRNRFLPDPTNYYLSDTIKERPNLELVTTADMVLYGFLAIEGTKLYILLGPVREFSCSRDIARRIIKELGQPYSRIDEMLDFLAKTPRLSRSKMLKSLVFLNYIINEKEPPANYIDEVSGSITNPVPEEEQNTDFIYHNSMEYERILMSCIEFGKTEQLVKLLKNEKTIDANMGITANDPLRAFKNVFVTSVTLASRAAVSGGMDYENAMNISDAYLQTMEAIDDYNDVFALWRRMLIDYAERMRKCRRLNPTSKLVHIVFNYVSEHVYKKISTQDIAEALSFSRSYLCSRFKKDTGKNLSQYMKEVKIDEAKYLLASTNKAIVEVSDLLGFCSQNYFQTVFKQVTGITPKTYREHFKTKE